MVEQLFTTQLLMCHFWQ